MKPLTKIVRQDKLAGCYPTHWYVNNSFYDRNLRDKLYENVEILSKIKLSNITAGLENEIIK